MFNEPEEIYLKDYFKILAENKLLIGIIFFIFLITGVIFSFLSSKIYEVDTWLEIGKAKNVLIEDPNQIVRKIKEGIYGECECDGRIEAIVADKTNLIQIKIKTKNSEEAKKFLSNLSDNIAFEHNRIINEEKTFIDERIKNNEEMIKKLEKEIKLWEDAKKIINTNLADPIYQIMSFFAVSSIEGGENNIDGKKKDIEALKLSLNSVSDTKIVKRPNIFMPSQVKKFLLNIAIFGFTGLFLGFFLVFWRRR
jgi:capsular polysaccharide biosynthesis protein